jgi:hypothetical protein
MLTPSVLQDIGAYRSQYLLDEAAADRQHHLLGRGFHPRTAPELLQAGGSSPTPRRRTLVGRHR